MRLGTEQTEIIKTIIACEISPDAKICLFGSRTNDSRRGGDSDIDIAVELAEESKTLTNFFGLKRYLEKQLGKRIKLGIENAVKPIVKRTAQKDMLHV